MKALRGSDQASLKLVDHESGGFGLLENDLELPAFAFHVEIVFIADLQQTLLQIVKEGVGLFLEVVFGKHSGFDQSCASMALSSSSLLLRPWNLVTILPSREIRKLVG